MRSVEEDVRSEAASRVGLPHPWAWAVAAVVVGVAGALVYAWRPSIARATSGSVVGDILTGEAPLVVLAVVLLVTLWCVRRFLFARAVRRPGAIEVLPFVNGTGEDCTFDAATATFRKTLANLSLAAPTPLPGSAPDQGFLKSVLDTAKDAKGPLATVAGLLGALSVDCGYRVSVTARTAAAAPRCGLDVSVVAMPGGPAETRTVWASSWCAAARRAADVVGAYVLARTALCSRGPWPHWRGRQIDPELFGFYQRAQACVRKQRYEEALDFCFQALDLDPLNAPIRILACQVQEKLGLYLSAATGYADVIVTESATVDRRLHRRIERDFTSLGVTSSRRGRRSARPRSRNRESLLIARYRFICAIANADSAMDRELAIGATEDNVIRRTELDRLENRVARWSGPYRRRLANSPQTGPRAVRRTEGEEQEDLFRFIAWWEANELLHDYAWRRGRRRPRTPVSQGALRLLRVWTLVHLDRSPLPEPPELARCRKLVRWPSDESHRAVVDVVRREIERTPQRRRSFQEYYNAAAVLGVLLSVRSGHDDGADVAAEAAVGYLERAVASAPRTMVWQYSRWFAAEDQSLKVLRGLPQYVDFLERHFPGMDRREERPENVLHYLFSTHVLAVARNYARLRAETSRTSPGADEHRVRETQLRAVRAMHDYSRDYRDWRTRLALIEAGRDPSDEGARAAFERAFPRFQDEPGLGSVAPPDVEIDVDEYYDCLITRRLCPGIWPAVHTELGQVLERLARPDGNVAVNARPMWESLAELIDAGLDDREPPPRTTTGPVVAGRLDEFRRAARAPISSGSARRGRPRRAKQGIRDASRSIATP